MKFFNDISKKKWQKELIKIKMLFVIIKPSNAKGK